MRGTTNWSVIVATVDGRRVNVRKRKGQAPVLVDPHCPMAVGIATQAVQAPSGQVHVGGLHRGVKKTELQAQAFGMAASMPASLPVRKNNSSPLCRNDRIIPEYV